MRDTIGIAFCPVYQNPYQHLLTDALRDIGVDVLHFDRMPSARWLVRERGRVQVLHLHWLYGLYMHRYLTPVSYVRFLGRFAIARRLGYRIVWTAHNIVPHRMRFPPIHLGIRRLVMHRADAVIAHCDYARQELLRRFPRRRPTHVVPLGTYGNVYPASVTQEQAREHLGLRANHFAYLFLANIAPYKGLQHFVQAFEQQAEATDVLIIGGRNRDASLVRYLESAVARDSRIRLHAGFIPDDRMQYFLRAADAMVAPFEKILTSSSIMVGMSYGLPIIAPALGCLPELVTSDAGILYDPEDPDALARALRRIKTMDTRAMGAAAKAIAGGLQWDSIAQKTAAIYRECLRIV
ncbi:MAG: glycosyltransferase family 4 protein [Anaerolineae bacterium]|jgi:glycosyltransferase involved in cell wall biosynthesis